MSEAGISTTAFYARFDSKERVLEALVQRLLLDLQGAAVSALADAKGLEDGFDRGIDALVTTIAPHKSVVRLALTEAAASPGALGALRDALGALAAMLRGRLERLVARGDVAVTDAEALGWA